MIRSFGPFAWLMMAMPALAMQSSPEALRRDVPSQEPRPPRIPAPATHNHSPGPAGEVVIYDSLCIGDEQLYDNGHGAWCGGMDIFGANYNLEAADDFILDGETVVTEVTGDYLVFLGTPLNEVCLNIYWLPEGGRPNERETCHSVPTSFEVEPFPDTIFGLLGSRITAHVFCPLGASRWIVSMQPVNGDWGYQLVTRQSPPCGGDASVCAWLRSDCSDCCDSYNWCEAGWVTTEEWGYACGTLSMRVVVNSRPEPGACCLEDGTCADLSYFDCLAAGGTPGVGRTCGEVDCPQPSACCLRNGNCRKLTEESCEERHGTWLKGFDCADVSCDQPVACCRRYRECVELLVEDCLDEGGEPRLDDDCTTADCPRPWACCLFEGGCQLLYEDECLARSGVWREGLECADADCLERHACCFDDGNCEDLSQQACAGYVGTVWHGEETCAMFDCPQPAACCFDDGACLDLLAEDCEVRGGVWHEGDDCGEDICPQPGACCFGDGSCAELFKLDCVALGGHFDSEGTSCEAQCLCPIVARMRASCSDSGFVRARVRFTNENADGNVILISIGDFDFPVGVQGRKAVLIAGRFRGEQVVVLTDPDCGQTVTVVCAP